MSPGSRICSLLVAAVTASAVPTSLATRHLQSVDLPLTRSSYGFLTDIALGTPGQSLPYLVDWTWTGHYVVTTLCYNDPTATYDCLNVDQKIFNQTLSSTFINQTDQYGYLYWDPNHFYFTEPAAADVATDMLRIGPTGVNTTIQAANFVFNETISAFPFSGVYGLSPVFKGDNRSVQASFYQGWRSGAWPSPIVSFIYCHNNVTKAICSGHDGIQTLGGYNTSHVHGNITWYDIIVTEAINTLDFVYAPAVINYWALKLTRFSIGDEEQQLNQTTTLDGKQAAVAAFDHASYGRGAPVSVYGYQRLVELVGAKAVTLSDPPNNGEQGFYQFDCRNTSSLPPLRYEFAGSKRVWEIAPENYVEVLTNGTNKCTFNVRTLGDGAMVMGNFGETFAIDKYIMFDFETLQVGIADFAW
ncbi:hypothetical protein AbraIFM66951_008930 [Aspergillus brasiliensis]|uniref:Peptidase A1 domain-containing protein n=1 Tax=Aspergillus brasiliensis TaxID=319629 RepID=A0A9W5YY28_9EURO|nr:hypothetical protein AbraCBS73388_010735 [Aspergillus brasiliensis]GKZ46046.1 hypothetical protein AbraIFM66951_008930 [Aspergillus brasiliensis]